MLCCPESGETERESNRNAYTHAQTVREAGTEAEAEAAAEEETETTATATETLTHTLCRTCDSTVALAVPVPLPSTNEDTLLPGTVKSEDVESKTPTSASLNTRRCNSLTYDDAHACSHKWRTTGSHHHVLWHMTESYDRVKAHDRVTLAYVVRRT